MARAGLIASLLALVASTPASSGSPAGDSLQGRIITGLQQRFPGARIELGEFVFSDGTSGLVPALARNVEIVSESPQGSVEFVADGARGTVKFKALLPAWTPMRRVSPLQRLSREDFSLREVDVASGRWREVRGMILPSDADLERLESRQTLLQGDAVLGSAVIPVPDLRRGDPVRVRLLIGDITVSTQGTAVESGYFDRSLRVLTERTKRELVGKLTTDRIVEVRL